MRYRTISMLTLALAACASGSFRHESEALDMFCEEVGAKGAGSFANIFSVENAVLDEHTPFASHVIAASRAGILVTMNSDSPKICWTGIDFLDRAEPTLEFTQADQSISDVLDAIGSSRRCSFLVQQMVLAPNDQGGLDLRLHGCRLGGDYILEDVLSLAVDLDRR